MTFLAVILLACMSVISECDYALDVCTSKTIDGKVFGDVNAKASDGIVLPLRVHCSSLRRPTIRLCSMKSSPDVQAESGSMEIIKTDIGARFYSLSCPKNSEPSLTPAAPFAKLCTDDMTTKDDKDNSGDPQTDPATPAAGREATDDVQLPGSATSVPVTYTLACDQIRIDNCTFAGGSRRKNIVTIAPGSSAYIVYNGTDYMLSCYKQFPARITQVKQSYADELGKDFLSAAWEQTVKSDYSTYPSDDQLILKKEDNLAAASVSIKIEYKTECFGEPARIQQCSYAGGGRLRDMVAIPPGKNGAYIMVDGTEFLLLCNQFGMAELSAKKNTAADDFCENAIQKKIKEKADMLTGNENNAPFVMDETRETTRVLSLTCRSVEIRYQVAVKAKCFGDRPIFKSCKMKRKGNSDVVMAGNRSAACIAVGADLKTMTKLVCDEFDKPRFTKKEKRC